MYYDVISVAADIDLSETVSNYVRGGMTVGLSGFSYMNPPMALVREIIKKGVEDLTIVSGPTSGIETDMLIGAGCVKKVITACVAFEKVASIAPNFRKFIEQDEVEIWECEEGIWHMGLKAGKYDIPYILSRAGIGTSIPELNGEIEEVEIDGKKYLQIPAINPEVSFIHNGLADKYRNVQYPKNIFLGRIFSEVALAEATKGPVIVSVEKIVSNDEIRKNPERTIIRNASSIVELPFGAHPGGSNGFYVPDLEHYKEYVKYCKDDKFDVYLDKYVYNVDFKGYLDLIGWEKLEELKIGGYNE